MQASQLQLSVSYLDSEDPEDSIINTQTICIDWRMIQDVIKEELERELERKPGFVSSIIRVDSATLLY